jgi:hypothetical protein
MKQAILIAYTNFHHLEKIIRIFEENFQICLHIDRKSKLSTTELEHLRQLSSMGFINRIFV